MIFLGLVHRSQPRWRRSPGYTTPKPSRAQIKYEEAQARIDAISKERLNAEAEVKRLSKPVKTYAKTREKQAVAVREAQKQHKSVDEQLAASHSIRGSVSYDEFLKARKSYDSARLRAFQIQVMEEDAKARADAIKPTTPKPSNPFIGILKFLIGA